jgi:hypothetical protein
MEKMPTVSGTTGLVDISDRVLDKGLVIAGDVRISFSKRGVAYDSHSPAGLLCRSGRADWLELVEIRSPFDHAGRAAPGASPSSSIPASRPRVEVSESGEAQAQKLV